MPSIDFNASFNFFIYLFIPFVCAVIARRFKLSPVIGYMVGGIALGNFFGNPFAGELIDQAALFGVVLLLFTIGLEINFTRMLSLKRFILLGGLLQIVLSALAIALIAFVFRFSFPQAFLVGIALATSSTAIVLKMIQDRGEEGSFVSEIVMGILMFQNLAFIPFILIFSTISKNTSLAEFLPKFGLNLFISAAIIWGLFYFGMQVIPRVFRFVASLARELLLPLAVLFILSIIFVFSYFKIPLYIGAFAAGVLVAQTREQYHIFSRIRPIRDLLATIFFIYIGTHVEVSQLFPNILSIVFFALIVLVVKSILIFGILLYFRFSTRIAFSASQMLSHVDEDAFIYMSLGLVSGIFTQDQYLFVVTTVILSLIFAPVIIDNKDKMYSYFRDSLRKYFPSFEQFLKKRVDFSVSPIDTMSIKDHIIICGYGRVGATIGRALSTAHIPYIAIDYNFHTVERAKRDGVSIIYGDPSDIDVLDFAGAHDALALISAVPVRLDQESIIINAKSLNPKIFIVSRVQNERDHERLKDLGAQAVVSPELEASSTIIKKILLLAGMPKDEIVKSLRHLKLIHGAI